MGYAFWQRAGGGEGLGHQLSGGVAGDGGFAALPTDTIHVVDIGHATNLYDGGSRGIARDLDAMVDKDYIDAKADAVRAQNDARFAEVMSHLDAAAARVDAATAHIPTTATMIGTAAATGIAVVGLIIGILAFGGDRFDGGIGYSAVSIQQAVGAQRLAAENAVQLEKSEAKNEKRFRELGEKLDVLTDLLRS